MVRQMHEDGADDEELRKILIERAGLAVDMLKDILYKPDLDDDKVLSSGTRHCIWHLSLFDISNRIL